LLALAFHTSADSTDLLEQHFPLISARNFATDSAAVHGCSEHLLLHLLVAANPLQDTPMMSCCSFRPLLLFLLLTAVAVVVAAVQLMLLFLLRRWPLADGELSVMAEGGI